MTLLGFGYAAALAIALAGMIVLDRRFRLFFWRDARRAAIVLAVGVAFFLVWDLFGIGLGVFFRGETSFMTGLLLAPELPVEEVGFLTLLCYNTMNIVGALSRIDSPGLRASRGVAGADRASRPAERASRRDAPGGGRA
jgi:lycopene cyclase domain-containing protein